MPNRVIKESAFTSDKISELSDFEFRLWVGLITQADDIGRGDARPAIIKGRIFALRDRTTLKDIDAALQKLAAVGCVSLYVVGGKPYFQFPKWADHQRVRNAQPKFPGPEEADDPTASPQLAATRRNSPPPCTRAESNPIQSNPNPIQYSAEVQAPSALTMPLLDGSEFDIFQSDIDEWQDAYPAVDVMQELKKMRLWCKDHPKNRKTKTGVRKFITGWLDREQNRGGKVGQTVTASKPTPPPNAAKREKAPDYLPEWAEGSYDG